MISLGNKKHLLVFSLFFFLSFFGKVSAATLYLQPSKTQISVGNIVNVQVMVNTTDQTINNAESVIQYPTDLLEIISLDKTSIFSLWVEDPSFSNNTGQVSFNGGIPNPGYQGSKGKIISLVFRTKKAGTASVTFLNSAVRANDGVGTDVLTTKSGAEIRIIQEPVEIERVTSLAMNINSSSHPNQNNWYNKTNVKLSWSLPPGTEAVKTLLGAYPNSEPTVYYRDPITKKEIADLEEGIWYFHASYLKGGVWSKTEHFRIKVDTTSPTDLVAETQRGDNENIVVNLKASDSLSGVDYFKIAPDSEDPINVKADKNGEASAEIPFSTVGEHKVVVSAYDKTGNSTETEISVVTNIISELSIDSYPAEIKVNESIEASGSAPYPYAQIKILLKNGDGVIETYKVKSDSYYKFNFISQPIPKKGKYTLWAEIINNDGEIRYSSDKLSITVDEPLLLQIGSYTIGLMKVLIPALILLIIFLLILFYGWLKFFALYRKVRKEGREAEQTSDKMFKILREGVDRHIEQLRKAKRKLTAEEMEFLEEFDEKLGEAEKAIRKEIQDITRP